MNDFSLVKHKTFENTYYLQFSIKNNTVLMLQLREDTQVIVMLDDGQAKSYPMYGERLNYDKYTQQILSNKVAKFVPFDLLGVKNDIVYIKMVNTDLLKLENYNYIPVVKDFEIELYKKQLIKNSTY